MSCGCLWLYIILLWQPTTKCELLSSPPIFLSRKFYFSSLLPCPHYPIHEHENDRRDLDLLTRLHMVIARVLFPKFREGLLGPCVGSNFYIQHRFRDHIISLLKAKQSQFLHSNSTHHFTEMHSFVSISLAALQALFLEVKV